MKHILFSIAGGIILFIWQFLSNAMPDFHKSTHTYTPLQDSILMQFDKMGLKEGMYMLGMPDPNDAEAAKAYSGKDKNTWASINYQINEPTSMTMPMIRSLLIGIIISALLFFFFKQKPDSSLLNKILISLGIGFIAFLYFPYSSFIWYKEPDIFAYLLDGLIPWVVLGLIGHWMLKSNRKFSK